MTTLTNADLFLVSTLNAMIDIHQSKGEQAARIWARDVLTKNPELEQLHEEVLLTASDETRLWCMLGHENYELVRFWMIATIKVCCKRIGRRIEKQEQAEITAIPGWGAF